ncbi:MAG TPA: hypothetical protein VFZ61_10065 [Polyangiales bacterium]
MTRTLCAALLAAAPLLACDGQVDTHYRGEPMMTLAGKVVSSEMPLASDVVPAFVFRRQEVADWNYRSLLPPGTQSNYFIRGEVSGSFPNAFTMTVFDAPPASVLRPMVKGEPPIMLGEFVAIPRDHPAQLIGDALPPLDPASTDLTSNAGAERIQLCDETGLCIVKAHHCPLGNPLPEGDFPCGPSLPDQPTWETRGQAMQHMILYVSAPVPANSYTAKYFANGAALAAGYHVVIIDPLDTDASAGPIMPDPAAEACLEERAGLMRAELRRVGAYGPEDQLLDHDAYSEVRARFEVDHPCTGDPIHRVADSAQPVNLVLSGPRNPFLFF